MMLLFCGALVLRGRLPRAPGGTASAATAPRVVCLLPQGTEILLAMGCGDHLAAVSNVDNAPGAAGLPRVGDYQQIDWERLAALHPRWIVTHYGPGHEPAGFAERAAAVGAEPLNLLTETLEGPDEKSTVYYAIKTLGDACGEPAKARAAGQRLAAQVQAVRLRWKQAPPVRALLVIGSDGTTLAGPGTFLDEALTIAGGRNAAGDLHFRYPSVDREQLRAMKPDVIVQLLPSATPQVLADARAKWEALAELPAVRNHRVISMTDWYLLLPGYHVGELAQSLGEALHGGKP